MKMDSSASESILFNDLQRLFREMEHVYSMAAALDLPGVDLYDRKVIKDKLYKIHDAIGERWAKRRAEFEAKAA